MTEKVKKINGLLMKAGLPHPPAFEGDREEQPRKVNTQKARRPSGRRAFKVELIGLEPTTLLHAMQAALPTEL